MLDGVAIKKLYKESLEVMVFNATCNNISVISWQSVLLVEETCENHRPVASTVIDQFYLIMLYRVHLT